MPRLQAKSFAAPDDVRSMEKARFETVGLDESQVGHCTFEPGWRWSIHVAPMMGTPSCPIRHLGYSVSGTVHVEMDDGGTLDIGPDTVFDIPPGHDQWVIGDEPWVSIEWGASGRALVEALQDGGTRSLATVLFTDIADSTATLQRVGDAAWRDLLVAHNARLREQLNVFRGREVKTTGDGVLAVFDSPTRAVRCALAMVRPPIPSGSRSGSASIRARSRSSAMTSAASRSTPRRGSSAPPGGTRCWCRRRRPTSSRAPGSPSRTPEAHELKGISGPRRLFRVAAG